jgi:hypothetical protein
VHYCGAALSCGDDRSTVGEVMPYDLHPERPQRGGILALQRTHAVATGDEVAHQRTA